MRGCPNNKRSETDEYASPFLITDFLHFFLNRTFFLFHIHNGITISCMVFLHALNIVSFDLRYSSITNFIFDHGGISDDCFPAKISICCCQLNWYDDNSFSLNLNDNTVLVCNSFHVFVFLIWL